MWSRYRVYLVVNHAISSPYTDFPSLIDLHLDYSTIPDTANMPTQEFEEDCLTLEKDEKGSKFGSAIDEISRCVSEFEQLVNEARVSSPSTDHFP